MHHFVLICPAYCMERKRLKMESGIRNQEDEFRTAHNERRHYQGLPKVPGQHSMDGKGKFKPLNSNTMFNTGHSEGHTVEMVPRTQLRESTYRLRGTLNP
ncbi:hypothetical protein SCLCIDRAFT_674998 [Scleroderma citrinum Foug A]|uniref:Uncharacterized protein n=1 Tax=Scleroderma citrinum Foug A TaxID=1036808 RepID=A0A0C2ZQU5_9AGAM|nr:hypothetical protein SCLCIDRAFT_674998 [Scleroderma citrinum Foug A]